MDFVYFIKYVDLLNMYNGFGTWRVLYVVDITCDNRLFLTSEFCKKIIIFVLTYPYFSVIYCIFEFISILLLLNCPSPPPHPTSLLNIKQLGNWNYFSSLKSTVFDKGIVAWSAFQKKMILGLSYKYTIKHILFCITINNKQLEITKLVLMLFFWN